MGCFKRLQHTDSVFVTCFVCGTNPWGWKERRPLSSYTLSLILASSVLACNWYWCFYIVLPSALCTQVFIRGRINPGTQDRKSNSHHHWIGYIAHSTVALYISTSICSHVDLFRSLNRENRQSYLTNVYSFWDAANSDDVTSDGDLH